MTSKKGLIENFFKERENVKPSSRQKQTVSKYSHNRVFDEPDSLKQAIVSAKPTIENGTQTEHKRCTNGTHNRVQTEHKRNTNGAQTVHKRNTQPGTNGTQNGAQTVHKRNTNGAQISPSYTSKISLSSLIGTQRKVIVALYKNCRKRGESTTDEMTVDHITELAEINKNSVKTTIKRLKQKGYISCIDYKDGRGGWAKYQLCKEIYSDLLYNENNIEGTVNGTQMEHKRNTNGAQTEHKRNTQLGTQRGTNVSSSSSSYINTTTTKLPEDWLNIDISDLSNIGFKKTHLIQLYKSGDCEPQVVQDSVMHFAFDLQHNHKNKEIKTNPLSYFMGILRRVGVYAAPDNYESPRDIAMRLYLKSQKAIQEKKAVIEKELFDVEFDKWQDSLSDDEKNQIIPYELKKLNLTAPKIAALRSHFEQTIWLEKKMRIMDKITKDTTS